MNKTTKQMKIKMKKLLFALLIITPLFSAFGQKVKVKKEVLSINKKEVGFFVEKKTYQKQKQFAVLNQQKDTLFKVGKEVVFSILDGEDEIYLHEIFSVPSKNIKFNYPIGNGYYLNAKSIIRHFISKGVIDEQLNLDEIKLKELSQNSIELPKDIQEVLDKEKDEMNELDFISDKVKDGIISLKKISSTSEKLKYLYKPNLYYFDTYEVYSSGENNKIQIGKVVIRYPLKSASLGDLGSQGAPTISRRLISRNCFSIQPERRKSCSIRRGAIWKIKSI
ncbi:hypothetical protein N7U66_20515 [Lacinutrix neustonica]|uniref:DUF4384 domain-containing protein n=1 Tax=Lacinutrix neustonica TaxID=2980107 RepID=A0A9E8MX07_9FLAO|nr:hypothetical protein [Lacinutrix neustonica]WAC02127.1 hypothetical protein N7U66_20515 [Lacinutrix neustonica]